MKKAVLLLSLFAWICNATAQEIDMADLYDFYNRINSGQQLPGDSQILEYLHQQYIEDSLVIHKTFSDKNGSNHLEINVINPCLQLKSFEEAVVGDDWRKCYRVDGWINCITVRLMNQNYSDTLIYYHPGVAMTLLNLLERNITLQTIFGKQAVFIPFDYDGTSDPEEILITCIILYNRQKYLYHLTLHPDSDSENYRIAGDLDEKFKDLPKRLKKEFIKYCNSQTKAAAWF